jgi:hypothetical protein
MTNQLKKLVSLIALVGMFSSCSKIPEAFLSPEDEHVASANNRTANAIATSKKFLFDAIKAENAGNADWIISENSSGTPLRFPSPAASTVSASTSENYWQGALSAWGIALTKQGHSVESLVFGSSITYGNTSNPQDLSKYDVYVIDEPNTLFTASEKTAIINFVKNGGGLFMISDHDVSDRNNDGKDSPAIWNDLMLNNSVKTNPFGFSVELTNISETSSNVLNDANDKILNGSQGKVSQLKFSNGATIGLNKTANASVKGLIWQNSAKQGTTKVMCASSTFGTGRIVLITDSSPADDGTTKAGKKVYPGWTEVNGNHARLHLNASLWLAKLQ